MHLETKISGRHNEAARSIRGSQRPMDVEGEARGPDAAVQILQIVSSVCRAKVAFVPAERLLHQPNIVLRLLAEVTCQSVGFSP